MSQYIIIDEHGEIFLNDVENKIANAEIAKEVLKNLKLSSDFNLVTQIESELYLVEAFDFPLTAHAVNVADEKILIHTDFDLYFETQPQQWAVDQYDQFSGMTTSGAPFKLSKKAHAQLFSLCKEYDDDSFTIGQQRFLTPSYYLSRNEINTPAFWNTIYKKRDQPPWDLNQPAEAFKDMLHRLKMPKSKILVVGCGHGHDAALLAEVGHVVTAIDFSAEALQNAKKKYGHLQNLNFEQMDIFNLPHDWNFTFDMVIEHTVFCAIDPTRRKELITIYKRMLHEEGQLMAVFFTMFKRSGTPYGSTEMELRELLRPHFQFLFWGRLRNSLPERLGKELFVLGKKR